MDLKAVNEPYFPRCSKQPVGSLKAVFGMCSAKRLSPLKRNMLLTAEPTIGGCEQWPDALRLILEAQGSGMVRKVMRS